MRNISENACIEYVEKNDALRKGYKFSPFLVVSIKRSQPG